MRFNRWVLQGARNDVARLCRSHPQLDVEIEARAKWMIAQLANDPASKGLFAKFPGDPRGLYRWSKGLLSVV